MANSAGRDLLIKKASTTFASVTQKSVTWNGNPIDITSDDDDAATTFLASEFATTSLEIGVQGYMDDDVLHDLAFTATDSGKHLTDITIVYANGDAISGNFILTNYSETGSSDGASEFSATLVRNGVHTFTPSA